MINPRQKTMRVRRFVVNSCGTHADLVNRLHCMVSRLWPATAVDAVNLADAVAQILDRLRARDLIRSIEFWGHGRPGAMCVGDDEVTADSFAAGNPHCAMFSKLLPRLADDAAIWFRGCQTFAGVDGKKFACAAAAFFGHRVQVLGQSRLLGFNLDWGGAVCLLPGQLPAWPDVDLRDKALKKQGDGVAGQMTRFWRRVAERWRTGEA